MLKVAKVRAAADIPKETRSRNRLSLVTTSYSGNAARMLVKSLSLSARQDLLMSATSSTCPEWFRPFIDVVVVGFENLSRSFE